jgi:predicted metal-dependent peptidase
MTDVEPLDAHKLAAARLWATNRYPYLASAVFAVQTLPAPDLGRMMVDRWWRLHADPVTVAEATVAELGGELLHLTSHLLRDHATRADQQHFSAEAELHHWVDAADAEIADDFPEDVDRVSEHIRPEDLDRPDGRLAEEYYRQGSVRDGAEANCGSGAHGNSPSWEPPPPSQSNDGSAQGVGSDEQQLIRRNVAAEVARANADAVSASLREWAKDQIQPSVDWRAELAALLRRAVGSVSGAVDYSYRRPSRRAQASTGVILPSLQQPTVEVSVICDTSASVSDELLGAAMGEVDGILRSTGTRSVKVLACDDAVQTVSRVTNGRDVALIGGGGTDMAVGIDAAMADRPRPDLLVVLTDGYTPWPTDAPAATVVVGMLHDGQDGLYPAPVTPPAWCRTVAIHR